MGHEYEARDEVEVPASPEQVWEAIATGPGINSWFMGRNEVDPGEGGAVRMVFGGYTPEHRVTAWEPQKRLAYSTDPAPDGRFIAFEFLIEGRESGSTVVRMVTSGFLPGDDWETEYDAMTKGGPLFFSTLVTYLTYFAGRTASPVTVFGPIVRDWDQAWAALYAELGLSDPVTEGDRVRAAPDGLAPIDGVVYFVNKHTLGVRTSDAMYRFIRGFFGPMIAAHQIFRDDVDVAHAEQRWASWFTRVLPPAALRRTAQ
jgi:uncharacterized protein YndB with AHSA1/START domain